MSSNRLKFPYDTVRFKYSEGGWFRYDRNLWQSPRDPGVYGLTERWFAVGPTDTSEHHDMSDYNARCSCCYLGFGHTEAFHTRNLEAASAN